MQEQYVVAASHDWYHEIYEEKIKPLDGNWNYIASADEFVNSRIHEVDPRYIFFLHWSEVVPSEIHDQYECVGFHMTDLPYGRGGSPLQNLIIRGHSQTRLSAFRITEKLDAGPIYLKRDLSLHGRAQQIYIRMARTAAGMIEEIVNEQPSPREQTGDPVYFERRSPGDSEIPPDLTTGELYDFIRMLDADGYPHAYVESGGFKFEFRRASLENGQINAQVTASPIQEDS